MQLAKDHHHSLHVETWNDKINPSSCLMLSTKNALKCFKPFCYLLSGSLPPTFSTIEVEVELDERLKKFQKWRIEGE